MALNVKKAKKAKEPKVAARIAPAWPRSFFAWALALLVLTGAAILHVRAQLAVVHLGYELSQAAAEHRELQTQRRKLQVEMATLSSPRRLRNLAREELNMVEPSPEQIIRTGRNAKSKLALGQRGSE